MKAHPKISVCLLVFNHAEIVESTIQTILEQTVDDAEIIVSDDCSTDGTWEVLKSIEAREKRVRVIRTPKNLGMPGNANFAVSNSTAPYIALLHHDDLYREDLLEKWAEVLDRNPDVGFVFNRYHHQIEIVNLSEGIPPGKVDGRWLLEKFLFPCWGCPIRGTAMIRRSAWVAAGGMRQEFNLLADVDLWMRLSMMGPVGYVDEPVISVRNARPDYYPDTYKETIWSWERLVFLYRIHGRNRETYLVDNRLKYFLGMQLFRLRLSLETAKWISYAIVRNKSTMLRDCRASSTQYDQFWLRLYRKIAMAYSNLTRK